MAGRLARFLGLSALAAALWPRPVQIPIREGRRDLSRAPEDLRAALALSGPHNPEAPGWRLVSLEHGPQGTLETWERAARCRCKECGETWTDTTGHIACPQCGGRQVNPQ